MNYAEKYEILSCLGKGRFGEVFLCKYKEEDIHKKYGFLALKRMNCESIQEANEIIYEMFEIGKLKHKNIVKYYDCFIDSIEEAYIVLCISMEYCKESDCGELLDTYVKDNDLVFSEEYICDFLLQVAEGLNYLHQNNIIHRDIKPCNIMITKDDKNDEIIYKICDFGFLKRIEALESSKSIVGTVRYFAPEIYKNNYSEVIDIFSLGVIVYEMLTKDRKTNLTMKLINTETNEPQIPDDIIEKINKLQNYSQDLKDLVLMMIEPDQNERINSANLVKQSKKLRDKNINKSDAEVVKKRKNFFKKFFKIGKKKNDVRKKKWNVFVQKKKELKMKKLSEKLDKSNDESVEVFSKDPKQNDQRGEEPLSLTGALHICEICGNEETVFHITQCEVCHKKACESCTINCFKHLTKRCNRCNCIKCNMDSMANNPGDMMERLFATKKKKTGFRSLFASFDEVRLPNSFDEPPKKYQN